MGTLNVAIRVQGPSGRAVDAEALVDTGATHTLLPRDVLDELGVETMERVDFQLADERVVAYEVGEVRLGLDGRERTVLVVFGA